MAVSGWISKFHRALGRNTTSLRGNLVAGLRLALPAPAGPPRIDPALGQFVTLLCGLWILSAITDLIDAGTGAEYSAWGVLSQATRSYLWIATLAIIVLVERRSSEFLRLAVAMASVSVTLSIGWMITTDLWSTLDPDTYRDNYATIWWAFLGWESLVFARVISTLYRAPRRRTLCYAVAYGAAVYAIAFYLPHRPLFIELWDDADQTRVDVEATYYAQANLLRQSLYALSPQRPGTVDLYFVGFAAYAHQDVFRREIEQAMVIVEQRFGAIGRTVSLINNLDTLDSVPLANRHNLEKTVRGLARRIDRDEDIVVLFLTSHGAEDATISVDLSGFGLNDISAGDLRKMLDDYEIKWRIIIVSACYSGSFIEALASPTTLVITAASADRSSFGCSHENEWTYFGEAYFSQALRQKPSFVAAFESASGIIRKREAAEGKEASKPQISVGSEISAYLGQHGL
jgi:Peptidase C13 family